MQDLIAKAATLLEALPYIQKFSGATFVVKYGGSFMDSPDPAVRNGVARDIVFLEAVEINPVVVHGGGKAITRAMAAAWLKADFIQGMRVTDEAAVNVVDRVLSREINPEIVKTIESLGGKARGHRDFVAAQENSVCAEGCTVFVAREICPRNTADVRGNLRDGKKKAPRRGSPLNTIPLLF